jgi:hypothetical protein
MVHVCVCVCVCVCVQLYLQAYALVVLVGLISEDCETQGIRERALDCVREI